MLFWRDMGFGVASATLGSDGHLSLPVTQSTATFFWPARTLLVSLPL